MTTSVYGVCVVVRGEGGEESEGYLKTLCWCPQIGSTSKIRRSPLESRNCSICSNSLMHLCQPSNNASNGCADQNLGPVMEMCWC